MNLDSDESISAKDHIINSSRFVLDIENSQEKCTPFMLALLLEKFDIAETLALSQLSNVYHRNDDGENAFDIANRMKIIPVLKYLIKRQERENLNDYEQKIFKNVAKPHK